MSYEQFKTPFYEIEIGGADAGAKLVKLPYQISRLIEKIEIKEILVSGSCSQCQFNLTFIEGSREPFSKEEAPDTTGMYPMNQQGVLSNRTGLLPDLRFIEESGASGITDLTVAEFTGIINDVASAEISAATNVLASTPSAEFASLSSNKVIILNDSVLPKQPLKFLFQQNNQVRVTWGYLENRDAARSIRGNIKGIHLEYPEKDHPRLTIMCADAGMTLDQVSGIFGTSFLISTSIPDALSGKLITNISNISIGKLIEDFCKKANIAKPIISKKYFDVTPDKHAVYIIPAGMSPEQFFADMASKYNALYRCYINPKDGKYTIAFISKDEYYKQHIITDHNLFKYKTPGSIIKSISLKAEFLGLAGAAKYGTTDAGENIAQTTKLSKTVGMVGSNANIADFDPVSGNPVPVAQGSKNALNTKMTVGTSGYNPAINNLDTSALETFSKAHCQSKVITVSMKTLGHPQLHPGALYITGVGNRFSGTYYFFEVHHTIDKSGYVCSAEGTSQSDYGLGKSTDGFSKTQEPSKETTVPMGPIQNPTALLDPASVLDNSDDSIFKAYKSSNGLA